METKLISVRVNQDVIDALDAMSASSSYYNRSYFINKMLEFCVSLQEQGQYQIVRDFWRFRGDKIQINDYDIIKGNFPHKNK